jgi:hypothetical protein
MYGLYKFFKKPIERSFDAGVNETVDDSVWQRWKQVADYRPPTLTEAIADGMVTPPPDATHVV